VSDPFQEGHAAQRRKQADEAAKREVTAQQDRIKSVTASHNARRAAAAAPYKGYPWPEPFYR